jgi:hypothetical protein
MYFAMFFYETSNSAGQRMNDMVAINNIDVNRSYTETAGNLTVYYKIGLMNFDGKVQKVMLATSEGAGGRYNVVGAFWTDKERFEEHWRKFEYFFTSLQ